eukprot:2029766-Rhodomonas_salina.2
MKARGAGLPGFRGICVLGLAGQVKQEFGVARGYVGARPGDRRKGSEPDDGRSYSLEHCNP